MSSDKPWSQRLEAQWVIPASLGFLYTTGFLVTNSHRALYQPVRVEIFEVQYLGAALLYSVLTVFSISIAVHAHRAGQRHDTRAHQVRSFLERTAAGFVALIVLIGMIIPTPEPFPEALIHAVLPLGYCTTIVGVVMIKLAWETDEETDDDSSGGNERDYSAARISVGLFLLYFGSTLFFGQTVYPRVSPVFGGGAKWIATVELEAQNEDVYALADSVMILDQSGGFQTVLSCVVEGQDRSRMVLAIPDAKISAIHYARMSSTGAYLGDMDRFDCVPIPATVRGAESEMGGS